jgi:hypothetical protein
MNKKLPYVEDPIYGDIDDVETYEDYEIEVDRLRYYVNNAPYKPHTDDSDYYDGGYDE